MLRELGRLWQKEQEGALRPTRLIPPASEVVARNAPCPCGSGRKYKNCCGRVAVGP